MLNLTMPARGLKENSNLAKRSLIVEATTEAMLPSDRFGRHDAREMLVDDEPL